MYKCIAVVTCACQGKRKQRIFRERNLGLFCVLMESCFLVLVFFFGDTVGIFVFLSWPGRIRITDKL